MRTIWGTTQHQQKLATGVYIVDTASHGGIIVRQDVADKYISEKVRHIVNPTDGIILKRTATGLPSPTRTSPSCRKG